MNFNKAKKLTAQNAIFVIFYVFSQVTTVSVNVRIQDVNDNYPQFEKKQYRRVIEEDATEFRPQFFIKVCSLLLKVGI